MLITGVFAFFLFRSVAAQTGDPCTSSTLCTSDFCGSQCAPKDCFIPVEECEGILLPLYENKNDFCGCCPVRCVTYLKEDQVCSPQPLSPFPSEVCGPQLSCQKPTGATTFTCLPSLQNCMLKLKDFNKRLEEGTLGMNENAPVCDDDGFYSPLQCYRGGLCRCVDKETGDPIFGITGGDTESKESNQNCKCAANYHEALKQGCRMSVSYYGTPFAEEFKTEYEACLAKAISSGSGYFPSHMRCLPNGNFDPIQCVTNHLPNYEPWCFCVDDDLNANDTRTFQSLTTDLKCYDAEIHNSEYFRPCEARAARRVIKDAELEGRMYYDGESVACSPDGFFDKVGHNETNFREMFCSDREGGRIDDYHAVMGTELGNKMDCECAFARRYLSEGVPKPTCCINGNFRRYQCQAGQCYCVDKFGRQQGKEVDQMDNISDLIKTCDKTCGDEPDEI